MSLHIAVAVLLVAITVLLPIDWLVAILLLLGLIVIGGWGYVYHPALAGRSVEFGFNESRGLCRFVRNQQGAVEAVPYQLTACRWLGRNCVVAVACPADRTLLKRYFNYGWLPLVFCSDNSSEEDRHQLAFQYHSLTR